MRAANDAVHCNPIDQHAENKTDCYSDGHRAVRRQPERCYQEIEGEHAEHDHGAVREVYDVHDSPNQGQSHGGEPIHPAHEESVDDGSNDVDHWRTSVPAKMEDWKPSSIFMLSLVDDVRRPGCFGPDHCFEQSAALLLPLGDDHLVADLQAVLLGVGREFGTAEHRCGIHAVEHRGDLGLLGRVRLLDGALQDEARRIAARRVVTRLDPIFGVESLREVAATGPKSGLNETCGSHCEGTVTPIAASPIVAKFGLSGATSSVSHFRPALWS